MATMVHLSIFSVGLIYMLTCDAEALTRFGDATFFSNSIQGHLKDIKTVLELYKASQTKILPNELVLDKLGSWSNNFLREELSNNSEHGLQGFSQEASFLFEPIKIQCILACSEQNICKHLEIAMKV